MEKIQTLRIPGTFFSFLQQLFQLLVKKSLFSQQEKSKQDNVVLRTDTDAKTPRCVGRRGKGCLEWSTEISPQDFWPTQLAKFDLNLVFADTHWQELKWLFFPRTDINPQQRCQRSEEKRISLEQYHLTWRLQDPLEERVDWSVAVETTLSLSLWWHFNWKCVWCKGERALFFWNHKFSFSDRSTENES